MLCKIRVGLRMYPLLFPLFALANGAASRLEVIVEDASGKAIAGARITVIHSRRETRATSDANGGFVFPSLAPGRYDVSVQADGFQPAAHLRVPLQGATAVRERFVLVPGSATGVQEQAAVEERLRIGESTISGHFSGSDLVSLPLLERSPALLSVWQPGTQIRGGAEAFSSVNGARQGSNSVRLDGLEVSDPVSPNLAFTVAPNNSDTIDEITVVTHEAKAEYGRNAGAQIEMLTRSGGSSWSGNAFEYFRNRALNANDFFNNSMALERPQFDQNLFGFSLGGPLPGGKTLVFGNYEGRRTAREIPRNRTVPTPETKAGLFRWLPPGSSTPQEFDIAKNDPRGLGIDPTVAALLAQLPDPNNFDVGDGLNTGGFRFNSPNDSHDNQFLVRIDHDLSENHRIFTRFSFDRAATVDPEHDARFPGQPEGRDVGRYWGLALGSNWTLGPRTVNEIRAGYSSPESLLDRPARVAGPMTLSNSWTDPLDPAFSAMRRTPVAEVTDNLTLARGNHVFKLGLDYRHTSQKYSDDAGIYPDVTLSRANGNVPPASVGPSGAAVISAVQRERFENLYNDLLGRIDQVALTYNGNLDEFFPAGTARSRGFAFHEYGLFLQDDWKLRPGLTLNLGIRYELYGAPSERDGTQGSLDKADLIDSAARIADFSIRRGKWYEPDRNNLAPRFGFAWAPGNSTRTVVRGGYGIYYDRLVGATTNLVDTYTPGFSSSLSVFPNAAGADLRLSDGLPLPAQPSAPLNTPAATRSVTAALFIPGLRTGYVQQYQLTVQREVYRNTILEVGVAGSRGVKLFMNRNVNQRRVEGDFLQAFQEIQAFRARGVPVSATNTLVRLFGSVNAAVSAIGGTTFDQGLLGVAADVVDRNYFSRYAGAGVSDFYIRNFPQFDQLIVGTNDGRSYYDSLQITVRHHSGPLRLSANYTRSKVLDNISVDGGSFTSPIDNFNLHLNKGLGDLDRPHVFNSALLYPLPIGKSRRFGDDLPKWVNAIVGGWDLGMLTIWESGARFSASSGRQTAGAAVDTWADYSGSRSIGAVERRSDGVFWFTEDQVRQFSVPAPGAIGSSGRNPFVGPHYFNIDTSLTRSFAVRESHRVSLRAEIYNVLNNTNFANPVANLASPGTFAKVTATQGKPRTLQLALRYDF